jgi:hypothetical protein
MLAVRAKKWVKKGKNAANLTRFKLKSPFLCFFGAGKWAL